MLKKTNFVSWLITYLLGFSLFASQDKSKQYPYDKEEKEARNRLLKEFPVPSNSIELEYLFSFPTKQQEEEGIYLYKALYLEDDSKGNIYTSNQGDNSIVVFGPNGDFIRKFGQVGQGPGDLSVPHNIFITEKDELIVGETGNMRLQFLKTNGDFIKSFKIFKGYTSWVTNDKGLIYAIPTQVRTRTKHLGEVLSQEGEVVSTFGESLDFKYDYWINNLANIAINKNGEIFVAFFYHPIVRKYSQKGELLGEYKIEYPIINKYSEKNLNNQNLTAKNLSSKKKETVSWRSVIPMIRTEENGFIISFNYPRLEFLVYDGNGSKKAHYWIFLNRVFSGDKFVTRNINGKKLFYVLQVYPENIIEVFGQK